MPASPMCADPEVPKSFRLHRIYVDEPDPAEGIEPVRWRLWTLPPIDNAEQLLAIVDIYRARWIIEEFFKALKTGCSPEKRQRKATGAG